MLTNDANTASFSSPADVGRLTGQIVTTDDSRADALSVREAVLLGGRRTSRLNFRTTRAVDGAENYQTLRAAYNYGTSLQRRSTSKKPSR